MIGLGFCRKGTCVRVLSLFIGLFSAATLPCAADTVILKNADRLTGEIQKLEKAQLLLKTSYAGTIRIDWKSVENVSAERLFEVEFDSGQRVKGTIRESSEGLVIVPADASAPLLLAGMVGMAPVAVEGSENFWTRLEGGVDLGYSFTRGNSQFNQSALTITTRYRQPKYQFLADLSLLYSTLSAAPKTSRHAAALRYDRFLSPKLFAFALSGLERDERQRLNLRTNLGSGLGWRLIKTDRTQLSLLAGVTYINEQYRILNTSALSPRSSSGEGLVALDVETTTLGRVVLTTKLGTQPNLVDTGRYRITFDAGMRVPLIRRFTWNLHLFDRFDSRPPVAVLRNDYGLTSSFGVTF